MRCRLVGAFGLVLVLVASTGCDRAFGLEHIGDLPDARAPGRWAQVAVGYRYVCAIDIEEHLWCWGDNASGQLGLGMGAVAGEPTQVGGATWRSISAKEYTTCGVQTDGSGWCWGDNYSGQVGIDTTTLDVFEPSAVPGTWQSIVAAHQHTCGIRDTGKLACWGEGLHGQLGAGDELSSTAPRDVLAALTWKAVQPGLTHTCAIADNGDAYCWGDGSRGELGDGLGTDTSMVPKYVNVMHKWDAVAGGTQHLCALRDDRAISCWGSNYSGQLGDGSVQYSEVPTPVISTEKFRTIGAGSDHTCAATVRGAVYCWGDNSSGQSGGGANVVFGPTPNRVNVSAPEWIQIAGGRGTTCAIASDHNMWCWGANIGASGDTSVLEPIQVPGEWKDVSAGSISTCAIASDDSLACWGRNSGGVVGDGTRVARTSPVTISAGPWRDVFVSNSHACALDAGGLLYCWGTHYYSLGDGARLRLEPTLVSGTKWSAFATGQSHTLAIEEATGRLWCWGSTGSLQCPTTTLDPRTPELTTSTEVWTAVAVGSLHSCGVAAGVTKCMGSNYSGELGDGTQIARAAPMPVSASTGLTTGKPHAGLSFNCAIQGAGLWCWGASYYGQVGSVTPGSYTAVPTVVPGSWQSVATGDSHACAIADNAALWCWGSNTRGQLGNGTVTAQQQSGMRYQVGTELAWSVVSAGGSHTCAIKNDASLWCWGDNEAGQLGIGTGAIGEPRFVE